MKKTAFILFLGFSFSAFTSYQDPAKIKLELTAPEFNAVVKGLMTLPYSEAVGPMESIGKQYAAQFPNQRPPVAAVDSSKIKGKKN